MTNARKRGSARSIVEPAADVAHRSRLLDAVHLRAGFDQHVDDLGHPEHRRVQ